MNDQTLLQKNNFPTAAVLQQTGKTNLHVTNEAGGVVNVNYNISSSMSSGGNSAEQMIAVQTFSRKYYQLIVTCEEDVLETNVVTVQAARALTKYNVPAEIFDRCSTLSDAGIEELKRFPAVVCRENTEFNGVTDPNQWAVYAYIKKVRVDGQQIKIVFQPIAPIHQQKLCDRRNAVFFDLNMECAITDLNRSAWSVHKTNLFEAFREAGIPNMPMPPEEMVQ